LFQNWNTSSYGEPLLKIFSVQALLRVSIDYLVGISLIHRVNKAFSKMATGAWSELLIQFYSLIHFILLLFSLISTYSSHVCLIHCPYHLFNWGFPPIQRCLSLIRMNKRIMSWFFTFVLFIRSKTYSYRTPKSHLVLKIVPT
jgi:hypothetical protein